MTRSARLVLRFVIVEGGVGDDFGNAEDFLAHHRAGEFAARDVAFHHHLVAEVPFRRSEFGRRPVVTLAHDENADGRALAHRLDDIGWVHDVAIGRLLARHDNAFGNGKPRRAEDGLRPLLVHGERGSEHARMRVGHAQDFEQALHATILAPAPMQRIEGDVRLRFQNLIRKIAPRVDLGHMVTAALQRFRADAPRDEAHLALRTPSALQNRDVLSVAHARPPLLFVSSARAPIRRISQ